eukprot:CAMPEP_0194026944 /NCGR_PEP_ID=MMETSP0009_2-20130614/1182_1 /TAXON_ID=210454 /ORGANISM="Grammatophora oceanica, Strain CCMP 410" /LENGTH=608 /DNA_ID=CAMNT_0038665841 /DNA_START=74 /DNA_END=1900 /DNA_ORIENTATION=-
MPMNKVPIDDGSETTSLSDGAASDPELAKGNVTASASDRRSKSLVWALLFIVVILVMVIGVILVSSNQSDEETGVKTSVIDSAEEASNTTVVPAPSPTEVSEKPAAPSESPATVEDGDDEEQPGDVEGGGEEEITEAEEPFWSTYDQSWGQQFQADVPLFSVGNFTGLGSVISFHANWMATRVFIGDPSKGCVTVMAQTSGAQIEDLWLWNATSNPNLPVWEMVGEPICVDGTLFGSHVSPASANLESDDKMPNYEDFPDYQDYDDAWMEWEGTVSNRFLASNPTDGSVSLYMYSIKRSTWELIQTFEAPQGFQLENLFAEEDTIAISYLPMSATAMARSPFRSPTDARIDVYSIFYEFSASFVPLWARPAKTSYKLVGKDTDFDGVDFDTDSEAHVVTLSQDRTIRAYRRSAYDVEEGGAYSLVGKAFKPAKVLNDDSIVEEDLTIVKCDYVNTILTAAIGDAGSNGKKTLGIGTYNYYNATPNAYCDLECMCWDTSLYPDKCDQLEAGMWVASYHGATEFEPNPTEANTVVNFNEKGSLAFIATKNGFAGVFPYSAESTMDFDLRFDQSTYASHKIIGQTSFGIISVMVESIDGTQEIQNWMMSGC